MPKRLLITGSRNWDDRDAIVHWLSVASHRLGQDTILVSGACPKGADRICEEVWEEWGFAVERHPADWRPMKGIYNKRAGFERNQKMVDLGADACLAFIKDNSGGATHCANAAQRAHIPTRIVRGTSG